MISGVCLGRMPSSPDSPGGRDELRLARKIEASALTTSTWMVDISFSVKSFRFFERFDGADHVERLLRQVVTLPFTIMLSHGSCPERHVLLGEPVNTSATWNGCDRKRWILRGVGHGQLVFGRQFVHAQNRDDVAQFLVALQRGLNRARAAVVLFTNHQRIDLARRRVERIHGGKMPSAAMSRDSTTVASKWAKVVAGDGSVSRRQARTRPGSR